MSNREDELAGRIAQRLDQSLVDVDQGVLAQLRTARGVALEKMQVQPTWQWAWAGAPDFNSGPLRYLNPRYLLPLVTLLAVISGMVWQQMQHIDELADIDANLLSGDLPIDAYLDKGLDSWLKH